VPYQRRHPHQSRDTFAVSLLLKRLVVRLGRYAATARQTPMLKLAPNMAGAKAQPRRSAPKGNYPSDQVALSHAAARARCAASPRH
jgi:hypothetical protein